VLPILEDVKTMKKLIGLFVICFAFSLSALAQHGGHAGGGRPEVGGGRQNIPKHAPARVATPRPVEENHHYNDKEGHPTLLTCTVAKNGWATIQDATTRITIWIIRGSMADSLAVSVAVTSGTWEEVAPAVSGSAVSSSPSLRTILVFVTAGSGIRMTS
jgi:hypothetical protein